MSRAEEARESPPVNAGLRVSNLVETGYPEPVGAPTLPLVHEVTNGEDHLQHLLQALAEGQLPGGQQDGWGRETAQDAARTEPRQQGPWLLRGVMEEATFSTPG